MRLSLFPNNLALNAQPVVSAFVEGCRRCGFVTVENDVNADVAVIWSLLWAGRMKPNQEVWSRFRRQNKPVIFLEVGMLKRNHTWRMGVYREDGSVDYGRGLDVTRIERFASMLKPWRDRGDRIIVASQRAESQQWQGMPDPSIWLQQVVDQIRMHSDREILIRPHPRQTVRMPKGCLRIDPMHLPGTYDDFDFDHTILGAHAVINWNSGPGSQAIIQGVPAFVGPTSLAAPVANLDLSQIERPVMPDRNKWFQDICHTEWTLDEIGSGLPVSRLFLPPFG